MQTKRATIKFQSANGFGEIYYRTTSSRSLNCDTTTFGDPNMNHQKICSVEVPVNITYANGIPNNFTPRAY